MILRIWRDDFVVPPIRPARHERPQIHVQILHGGSAEEPPAVINLVNRAVAVQHEGIRNRDRAMMGISRIHNVQRRNKLLLLIAEKRKCGGKPIPYFSLQHRAVDRDDHEVAIIHNEFGLQVRDVVRQLATIFRSIIAARENYHGRKAAHNAAQANGFFVLVWQFDIGEFLSRP
jgi:hypothetical protein